jgi:hypothetical protein
MSDDLIESHEVDLLREQIATLTAEYAARTAERDAARCKAKSYVSELKAAQAAGLTMAAKIETLTRQLEWQGGVTKALLPYQDRAVQAEAQVATLTTALAMTTTILAETQIDVATLTTDREASRRKEAETLAWANERLAVAGLAMAAQIETLTKDRDDAQNKADVRGNMLRYIAFVAGGDEAADPQLSVDRMKAQLQEMRDYAARASGWKGDRA